MNDQIKKHVTRIGTTVMSAAMALTFIPFVTGNATLRADWEKSQDNTEVGISQISAPEVPETKDSAWEGSYVYYGVYSNKPVRYRVLAPHTTIYGGDTMFLDCDTALFDRSFDKNKTDWASSNIRTYLNETFFNSAFNTHEKGAITSSTIEGKPFATGTQIQSMYKNYVGLNNDKIFLLDASDVVNPDYGYSPEFGNYDSNIAFMVDVNNHIKFGSGGWWLRSSCSNTYAGAVDAYGIMDYSVPDFTHIGVSPAMNIDLSRVIFSTDISGTTENSGKEYKLTVVSDNIDFAQLTDTIVTIEGSKVTFPYYVSGEGADDVTQVSYLILDKEYVQGNTNDAKILAYGAMKDFNFDLPSDLKVSDWGTKYHVYALAEDVNGSEETDFANFPYEIEEPVSYYSIKVTSSGKGMVASSISSGMSGESVTLNATPNNGYRFKEWQVVKGNVTISDNMFVIGEEDIEIIAVFEKITATPTATPIPTATATPVPTATSVPTSTPTAAPTATSAPTAAPTDAVTPTAQPSEAVTPTMTPTPTESADPKSQILDFVKRIYIYVLDREPEEEGAAFWSEELYAFHRTGAEVAQGFIFSEEFENRKTSDTEFVTILYKTFFGRDPEEDGMNFWLNQLSSGTMDRVTVANGFIYSQEWADTCASYGIRSGGDLKPTGNIAPTELTYAFVERMYTTAMGRGYDEEGKQYWAGELANFNITGEQVGASFFLSEEMVNYKLDDKEFVNRLYLTFMDREADEEGAQYWLGVLASGSQRSDVVFGFTRSPEFTSRCIEARILPY